jgi:molybdopterin-containing oxidoreductase family iron-sulfur binding subunit
MKNHNQDVWVGTDQLENNPEYLEAVQQEFYELPVVDQLSDERSMKVETNRRDFLKYLGFGLGAATIAASCEIPVKKAIPYVTKPDTIVPGIANYYASSFVNGGDYCSVLVKTREGRPIKIEGNPLSSVTQGGTSARVQASVLSLYDTKRYQTPMSKKGDTWEASSWGAIDKVAGAMKSTDQIRIVTNTVLSPTAKAAMAEFTAKFTNAKVVTYDAVSSSAILQANQASFGQKAIPSYHFDKADMIVSFGADFLGTWISPIEYARQYASGRKVNAKNPKMSRHVQVESGMTMTGSNADNRILVRPSETGSAIANLYSALGGAVSAPALNAKAKASINALANELKAAKGKCLVVSGSNNYGEQVLVNAINNILGSYGNTITWGAASMQRQGLDSEIQSLITEMESGNVKTVIVWGANPAYDLPNSDKFRAAFAKVGTKISLATSPDETTALCDHIAPGHHNLESWGDAMPKRGHYSLIQPTITPLFSTRQAEESILRWAGSSNLDANADQPYYDYLKNNWKNTVFTKQSNYLGFQAFWDASLHDGVVEIKQAEPAATFSGNVAEAANRINQPSNAELEISFFETVNIGGGQYANNPWLMEMPDPITRTVWGNYLMFPIVFDGNRRFDGQGVFAGLNQKEFTGHADVIGFTANGKEAELTGVRQFGQMHNTAAVALGYGRTVAGNCGENVGVNAFEMCTLDANGNTQYYSTNVAVAGKVREDHEFACVQYHHTFGVTGSTDAEPDKTINLDEQSMMTVGTGIQGEITDRSIIFKTNLNELPDLKEKIHDFRHEAEHLNEQTLYPYEEYKETVYGQGHHWGMHVDMNACIGCGACQVACVAENNVPVVGKYEVFRHHEMTWMRIDRYFYGDYENPKTVYQPMMCQHCDNAPCENVCPVAATNHSSEGLNQMAYNRCIGTRYCANNCPYKVRRFNWMDYTTADLFGGNEPKINGEETPFYADNLTRMVLNPDVTVRSRGVMEKCSFCVQRIQEAKLTAKRETRMLRDGDVKSACQTSCPTGAITFGDINIKDSAINKALNNPLNYQVLEEINVRPSVTYSAVVTNSSDKLS